MYYYRIRRYYKTCSVVSYKEMTCQISTLLKLYLYIFDVINYLFTYIYIYIYLKYKKFNVNYVIASAIIDCKCIYVHLIEQ